MTRGAKWCSTMPFALFEAGGVIASTDVLQFVD
jgi:hypothetical protein